MKLLVTGGTGFTGSALVKFLLDRGHDVNCLDNQKGLFYDELKAKGASMMLASVTDRDAAKKALEGVEGVFHLAAAFRVINVPKRGSIKAKSKKTGLLFHTGCPWRCQEPSRR